MIETQSFLSLKTIDCLNQDLEILVVKLPTLARSLMLDLDALRVNGEACIMCALVPLDIPVLVYDCAHQGVLI